MQCMPESIYGCAGMTGRKQESGISYGLWRIYRFWKYVHKIEEKTTGVRRNDEALNICNGK